jgi:hypothetical protein
LPAYAAHLARMVERDRDSQRAKMGRTGFEHPCK